MAEAQSKHRREIEAIVVRGNTRRETIGQVCALVLGLVIAGVAAFAISRDQNLAGVGIVAAEIAGFGGAFMYGRKQQREEREKKASTLPVPKPSTGPKSGPPAPKP